MQLKPLIDKVLHHEELDSEEKIALENFDPDTLIARCEELKCRLDDAENSRLTREERLQKELNDLKNIHAALENDHQELRRRNRIEKLAEAGGCLDAEYLDFCARRAGVDLENPAQVETFMEEISRTSPGCFRARIHPGSSAGCDGALSGAGQGAAVHGHGGSDRIGRIVESLGNVPDVR